MFSSYSACCCGCCCCSVDRSLQTGETRCETAMGGRNDVGATNENLKTTRENCKRNAECKTAWMWRLFGARFDFIRLNCCSDRRRNR
jgi:hypothetical protein